MTKHSQRQALCKFRVLFDPVVGQALSEKGLWVMSACLSVPLHSWLSNTIILIINRSVVIIALMMTLSVLLGVFADVEDFYRKKLQILFFALGQGCKIC